MIKKKSLYEGIRWVKTEMRLQEGIQEPGCKREERRPLEGKIEQFLKPNFI